MRRHLVPVAATIAFALGFAVLLSAAPTGAASCTNPKPGNGKHECSLKCGPCETAVCEKGGGWCNYHCEPIPGCTPS